MTAESFMVELRERLKECRKLADVELIWNEACDMRKRGEMGSWSFVKVDIECMRRRGQLGSKKAH